MADVAEDIAGLVADELALIRDAEVRRSLQARLVTPTLHLRSWDYGAPGEQFSCWTIAIDPISDSSIVYSRHGFGPKSPWGLVSTSNLWFGMDCGWYLRLEDAFIESRMARGLPIWDVVVRDADGSQRTLASSLTMDAAFQVRDAAATQHGGSRCEVMYRSQRKDGVA